MHFDSDQIAFTRLHVVIGQGQVDAARMIRGKRGREEGGGGSGRGEGGGSGGGEVEEQSRMLVASSGKVKSWRTKRSLHFEI